MTREILIGQEALVKMQGFRMFKSPREMLLAVRRHVVLKWLQQHHEMELSDGEETHGFVGTPEW